MKETKKTAAVETSVKAEETLAEKVTEKVEKKAENTVERVAEKAKATAKTTAKKASDTAKKAPTAAKAGVKKAGEATKKNYVKMALQETYIQMFGNEYKESEILDKVEAQFVSEGHRVSNIRTLNLYVKPEDNAAYYVINEKYTGRVDL